MTPGFKQFLGVLGGLYIFLGFFAVLADSNKHSPPRRRNQFDLSWLNKTSTTEYVSLTDGKQPIS